MSDFPVHQAAVLGGHNGPVHCLAFSAGSGSYLLTGSADRTIRLFNVSKAVSSAAAAGARTGAAAGNDGGSTAASAALVQTFAAHAHSVLDLAVSRSNGQFASVGGDRQVFLWDVATGSTLRRWTGHAARVNAVAFAGVDDSVLISGSFDATARLWDVRNPGSGRPIMTLAEARDSVTAVCVGGGGGTEVITASADGRLRAYDLRMGQLRADCVGAALTSVEPSPVDGQTLLVGSLDSRLRIFDAADGRCLREFSGHANDSLRMRSCFGGGGGGGGRNGGKGGVGTTVLGGSEDGGVYAWDVVTGNVLRQIKGDGVHGGKVVTAVAWNHGGDKGQRQQEQQQCWASAGSNGTVTIWNSS